MHLYGAVKGAASLYFLFGINIIVVLYYALLALYASVRASVQSYRLTQIASIVLFPLIIFSAFAASQGKLPEIVVAFLAFIGVICVWLGVYLHHALWWRFGLGLHLFAAVLHALSYLPFMLYSGVSSKLVNDFVSNDYESIGAWGIIFCAGLSFWACHSFLNTEEYEDFFDEEEYSFNKSLLDTATSYFLWEVLWWGGALIYDLTSNYNSSLSVLYNILVILFIITAAATVLSHVLSNDHYRSIAIVLMLYSAALVVIKVVLTFEIIGMNVSVVSSYQDQQASSNFFRDTTLMWKEEFCVWIVVSFCIYWVNILLRSYKLRWLDIACVTWLISMLTIISVSFPFMLYTNELKEAYAIELQAWYGDSEWDFREAWKHSSAIDAQKFFIEINKYFFAIWGVWLAMGAVLGLPHWKTRVFYRKIRPLFPRKNISRPLEKAVRWALIMAFVFACVQPGTMNSYDWLWLPLFNAADMQQAVVTLVLLRLCSMRGMMRATYYIGITSIFMMVVRMFY